MFPRRLLGVLVCCLALAGAVTPAAPSQAAATAPPTLSVTLMLAPQSRIGLDSLATASRLDPVQRRARLVHSAPAQTTVARAVGRLTALGLTVDARSPFTVRASGPAGLVTALFGSTRGVTGVAGQVPLHLPLALRTLATAVVGGDDAPLPLRHAASPGADYGAQVRQTYAAPVKAGAITPTIATLQFTGFQASDLTSFATANGLPDPVASGQFVAISVDGASTSTPIGNGDVEFALDQEALLATAPTARQRAYVAPSTNQGFVDLLNSMASDASATHMVAAASSWGLCESDLPDAARIAIHTAITNVSAAGVTFFAATGDTGSDDCNDGTAAVDFPASDPLTVAVGGTTLSASGSQTAWSNGGGGLSADFPQPAYQGSVLNGGERAVPDIAMQADADVNGFPTIRQGQPMRVGGTSLSAQLAAATFTNSVVAHGATAGVGDIHSELYQAQACGFTDVTSGSNGLYHASPGFDLTTGLGAPAWSRLAYALVPSTIGGAYVPLCPTRVLDTRTTGPVPAGGHVDVQIAGTGGVPASVSAVVINLTAVTPDTNGYLTAYAAGTSRPGASNLNFLTGRTVANLAIVPVSPGGQIALFNGSAGPTHMLADIQGYYVSGTGSDNGTVTPLSAPTRILDTRLGSTSVAPGASIAVQVGGAHGIPSGIGAVAINLTVTRPAAGGYATAYGADSARPGASTLNFVAGQTIANLAIVPVSPSGQIRLYNGSSGTTHVVVDVQGYVQAGTAANAGGYVAQTPARLLDTRLGSGPIGGGSAITLHLPPGAATAGAVAINLTVTGPTGRGYITAYPSGTARPTSSNLNFLTGQTVAGLAIVPVGADGTVTLYNGSPGSVQLVADLEGYVVP